MSIFDEMYDCIESARATDTCEYSVYSEMFDLIAEAETENAKLRELVIEQRELAQMRLAGAISECLWPGETLDQCDALMMVAAKVNRLSKELRIEAD